ncbi:JAB domain-containing protein [Cellulomonas hominis]
MAPILAAIDPAQRPRERLLRLGPDALSDAELVALLLGSGLRGVNAVELARDLLAVHGGLDGLSRTDGERLQATTGIGPAKATRVVAALALARRFGTSTDRRASVRTPGDVVRLLEPLLAGPGRDQVAAVVCDRANRVLATVVVGPHDPAGPYGPRFPVREILAETLRRDGVAVAVGHRHTAPVPGPDGPGHPGHPLVPELADGTDVRADTATDPTTVSAVVSAVVSATDTADRQASEALVSAAAQCGVRVLDHIVTDGTTWRSVLGPPARPRPPARSSARAPARTPAARTGSAR